MAHSVGTAALFAYAAYLSGTTRPQDRPWYAAGFIAIFLALVLFWQAEHQWVGVCNRSFAGFFGLHAAAAALGVILGCIVSVLLERRRTAG